MGSDAEIVAHNYFKVHLVWFGKRRRGGCDGGSAANAIPSILIRWFAPDTISLSLSFSFGVFPLPFRSKLLNCLLEKGDSLPLRFSAIESVDCAAKSQIERQKARDKSRREFKRERTEERGNPEIWRYFRHAL